MYVKGLRGMVSEHGVWRVWNQSLWWWYKRREQRARLRAAPAAPTQSQGLAGQAQACRGACACALRSPRSAEGRAPSPAPCHRTSCAAAGGAAGQRVGRSVPVHDKLASPVAGQSWPQPAAHPTCRACAQLAGLQRVELPAPAPPLATHPHSSRIHRKSSWVAGSCAHPTWRLLRPTHPPTHHPPGMAGSRAPAAPPCRAPCWRRA